MFIFVNEKKRTTKTEQYRKGFRSPYIPEKSLKGVNLTRGMTGWGMDLVVRNPERGTQVIKRSRTLNPENIYKLRLKSYYLKIQNDYSF